VRRQDRTADHILAWLATRSHGVVTWEEMLAAGIRVAEIRQRVKRGALIREYRGVYRVGHRAPSLEATYLAAVRACGKEARLSGRAAAHLLGLVRGTPPPPEVTTRTERRVPGIRTHRARRLDARDTTSWRGIPVVSVARALVELAAVLSLDDLARACHEAGVRHRTTPAQVEVALSRRPNSPGAPNLKRVIRGEAAVSLSKLEARFLSVLADAGLTLPPETNRIAGARRVDCRWPDRRLTVELDSYRYHSSRHAWEQDRRREREAYARGDDIRRYTYGDVFEHPRQMLAELSVVLGPDRPALVS
jgi:very-short-patch-repair endonuclease